MNRDFLYSRFEDGVIIQGYFGDILKMPLEINGKKVVAAGQIYYKDKKDVLKAQMIRNSSWEMGKKFSYANVKKVIINGNVYIIKCYAFYGSRNLESAEIGENVKEIENGVFMECSRLKYVSIKADIKEIPRETFKGCIGLKNINLPEYIYKIGGSAFEQCVNLTQINLENIKEIGRRSFYGCSSLAEIKLGKVKEISPLAFAQCGGLTCFQIEGCETIGDEILKDCRRLCKVEIKNNSVDIARLLQGVSSKIKLIIDYGDFTSEITLYLNLRDYGKCFKGKEIDFDTYDEISAFSAVTAFERLENPFKLSERAKEAYLCTLEKNIEEALNITEQENSVEKLKLLCENGIINKNTKAAVDILGGSKDLRAYLIEYIGGADLKREKYAL